MIGQTVSHYRISGALGAGAMGEVYRATDTTLGREVALKVLPAEMASSPERLERFRREAQALAALDHPGIVTVYSVEEADGIHFLTMQLVEGQSLDRLVAGDGLPVDRILAIAAPLAEALAAAHSKGVVHRDLKPANVMVTGDGRVKVLDFGLAKMGAAVNEPGSADLESQLPTQLQTREGVVMGTVPYMSPEQVSGKQLDSRSDLFSFGVLLYEMATGRRPFEGESPAETASAILRDTPTPPNQARADLPEGLSHVIARSLEKDPAARYASAEQLLEDLHHPVDSPSAPPREPARSRRIWIAAGLVVAIAAVAALYILGSPKEEPTKQADATPSESSPSIAVLPFDNLSGDPDQEYFSDGMAEEVLNALSSVSGLRVAARTSAFSFKGKSVDVREVGQKLDVDHVLEGSVRRSGSQLRINAQLVSAEDGYQLWSDVFDREMTDVFEVQEEIAQAIVTALRGQFELAVETSSLVRPGTDDLEAYNDYLRGRHLLTAFTNDSVRQSIGHFERAVTIDPQFSDAWGALAMAWLNLQVWVPIDDVAEAVQETSDRALALDPDQSGALAARAWYTSLTNWDWRAAEDLFQQIGNIEDDAFALDVYAALQLQGTGRVEEAVALYRRALQSDPFHDLLNNSLVWLLLGDGRPEEALIAVDRWLAVSPDHLNALSNRVWALTDLGRLDELPVALERFPEDNFQNNVNARVMAYHALGDSAMVERLIEQLRDLVDSQPYLLYALAQSLIATGHIEEGLTVLEEAILARELSSVASLRVYFGRQPGVWQHPRFQALLARTRLADESLREQGFEVEAR